MSIIYSTLRYSVSLIAEPFVSMVSVLYASVYLNDPNLMAKKRNADNVQLQSLKKVEGVALEKINLFLSELGAQPGRIIATESGQVNEYNAAAGSLRDGATAVILFNPKVVEEIQTDFTLEHRFWIAHEVGHLLRDDVVETKLLLEFKSSAYRLIALTISLYAFGLFTDSALANLFLSCNVAAVTGLLMLRNQKHTMELKADFWAAQQSHEIAQAGIAALKKLDKVYHKIYKEAVEKCVTLSKNSSSSLEKISLIASTYYNKLILSAHERGISLFMTHPHPRTRIAAISKSLEV